MARVLLFVILLYYFHGIKAQASVPPILSVSPPAITETDSVTLSCQTPSSVSVSQCDFYTASQKLSKGSSCVQTLTATELLKITQKSLPAAVEVRCSYTVQTYTFKFTSPDSEPSTININNLRPPKLTVSPLMITETDSVTLNCQNPLPVSQCYFIISGDKTAKTASCLQTLTGSEFLSWTRQRSPVTVELTCYYLYIYKSPLSNMSPVTIQIPWPEINVHPPLITETDSVTLSCQTPSSVSVSQCDFYIASQKLSKGSSCVQTLTGTELLKIAQNSLPAEVEVRCSYTLQTYTFKRTSPDSEPSTINIIDLHPPKLTVSPLMITETESVTVNCQTPSSVPVSQCYFIISGDKTDKAAPCLQTLTGSEFLSWTRQSSPVTLEMTCYYLNIQKSPVSNMTPIIIQTPRPELTVNPAVITETDSVTVNCQTPSSVSVTQCFLYFMRRRKSTSISCQQTLTATEIIFMAQQSSPAEVQVACFYMTERKGGQYQSPHSIISSISIQYLTTLSTFTTSAPISMKDQRRNRITGFKKRNPSDLNTLRIFTTSTPISIKIQRRNRITEAASPSFVPGVTLTAVSNFTAGDTTLTDPATDDGMTASKIIWIIGAVVTVDVLLLVLPLLLTQTGIVKCGSKI
ncbi:uncharacterized protein LOC106632655 [Haplochromis burtoni]|uniref:uncharacterized protein LOC106632655 n=1 Tax=Haplochromis burtoni TaxID=8153 RepID=UPI001C2D63BA|nr:uncharacterized protein LOC106632655 [Haplochromis burtoni]